MLYKKMVDRWREMTVKREKWQRVSHDAVNKLFAARNKNVCYLLLASIPDLGHRRNVCLVAFGTYSPP